MALLVLGFAAVPFSLNAAGFNFSLGSRICSVASAWQQIAGVFSNGYQPINTAFWAAVDDPSDLTDKPEDQPCEIASLSEGVDGAEFSDASPADSAAVSPAQPTCSKPYGRALVARKRVEVAQSRKAIQPPITVQLQALEVEGAMKSLSARQEELLKLIDERMSRYKMKLINASKFAPVPREAKVYVRAAEPAEATDCDLQKAKPAVQDRNSQPRTRRLRMPTPPRVVHFSSET
jgi:hypothetical protein